MKTNKAMQVFLVIGTFGIFALAMAVRGDFDTWWKRSLVSGVGGGFMGYAIITAKQMYLRRKV